MRQVFGDAENILSAEEMALAKLIHPAAPEPQKLDVFHFVLPLSVIQGYRLITDSTELALVREYLSLLATEEAQFKDIIQAVAFQNNRKRQTLCVGFGFSQMPE